MKVNLIKISLFSFLNFNWIIVLMIKVSTSLDIYWIQ